ncbi:hypothetical protein [Tortoise microvirus 47]|nr:hypothetical protein [Tortoise microvirus 47]
MLGAVGGVVSSIFGSKDKKQTTTSEVDYVKMVQRAEAAGFNPLTALRNGGSAGFSTSTTTIPGLSAPEVIGQSMGHVANFLQDFDPHAKQKKEAELEVAHAQIRNLNASSEMLERQALGAPGSFNVPQWGAGNTERRPSGQAGQLSPNIGMIPGRVGSGDGGAVESLYVDYWDPRTNQYVQMVNPGAPDLDQMAVPPLAHGENTVNDSGFFSKGPSEWGKHYNKEIREWWHDWTKPWRENVRP